MKSRSVKQRIFNTNLIMLALIFVVIIGINAVIMRLYTEAIENTIKQQLYGMKDHRQLESMLKDWTVHRWSFAFAVLIDIGLCAAAFFSISYFFTNRLTIKILTPLELLKKGSQRIQDNDLSKDIVYSGENEFESVCATFNEMQHAIRTERERIRKYEKARQDMISGVSHDLRTPLTAIQGSVKGMIDGVASTPEMQAVFLERAYARTQEMEKLLAQLLLFSRMETGNIPVNCMPVDLGTYLHDYIRQLRSRFSDQELIASEQAFSEAVCVNLDAGLLERILNNLLENSMKYAAVKPAEIEIGLTVKDGGAEVRFADHGPGVPGDKLPFLFEEFYRGDESRNLVKGNGLGLYIVKSLTEAMGGSASAENAEGLAILLRFPLCSERS